MRFIDGIPTENGATQWGDSARLAGLMALVDHPDTPDLRRYVTSIGGVRSPVGVHNEQDPFTFTRDQLRVLAAGLHAQGHFATALKLYYQARNNGWTCLNIKEQDGSDKPWYSGPDPLAAADRYHLAKCARIISPEKVHPWGPLWLKAEMRFNAAFTPLREPNQLIAMCIIAGEVPAYKKTNPKWEQAIREYWCGWRAEPELAEMLIYKLKQL